MRIGVRTAFLLPAPMSDLRAKSFSKMDFTAKLPWTPDGNRSESRVRVRRNDARRAITLLGFLTVTVRKSGKTKREKMGKTEAWS